MHDVTCFFFMKYHVSSLLMQGFRLSCITVLYTESNSLPTNLFTHAHYVPKVYDFYFVEPKRSYLAETALKATSSINI